MSSEDGVVSNMLAQNATWDPTQKGLVVRLLGNPGRQGTTTGQSKKAGSFLLVQVDFGPNDKEWKRADLLEPVETDVDMMSLMASGRFGGPIDLRRVLIFEKIKGDLTNIFYSMEASNTDFYPHQFKPVLKFIESPVGRLLIADEVGLGKTIESLYVWKELQAREDARRLLIVCPAMLRDKWRSDLLQRFNIDADILSVRELFHKTHEFVEYGRNETFACIASLEGLRPPTDYEDETRTSVPAQLARLFDQHTASDEWHLFDLVIMDEAHELRNPSTANNRLARLLREASRYMLLLTATPVQLASDNLYQLLRLIDPDQFYDASLFQDILKANAPVVRALRNLWGHPPDIKAVYQALDDALENVYFARDTVLARVKEQIGTELETDLPKRIELGRLLESRSLLGQYMARSRKRDVLEERVERAAQVLSVEFSAAEQHIYDQVTERIRQQASDSAGVSLFALIARQRQMASSLVAALEGWRDKDVLEELLWEDLGRPLPLEEEGGEALDDTNLTLDVMLRGLSIDGKIPLTDTDKERTFEVLERLDTKYNVLKKFLTDQLANNPSEKFVVFAFYRGTLTYLARRLRADGIRTALIMGGMGETMQEALQAFSSPEGPSVLLSSEVGSQGIDLQFCRFVVNYDLPWNPMKVEQRIGRIDRLGQRAEKISIINLALVNTIEDRILLRLYDRIDVFRESIGDLEAILGDLTRQLILDLIQPELTDEERDHRAQETEAAILKRRAAQEQLEQEAVNLIGFSDYILDSIQESREKGRWLSADELLLLVEDFFARQYPGTQIERHAKRSSAAHIRLSEQAQASLSVFMKEKRPGIRTRLHQSVSPLLCGFDSRHNTDMPRGVECIEPTHPLIQWIRQSYDRDGTPLYPVAAIRVQSGHACCQPGLYVFVAHRWSFEGLRKEHLLAFQALRVADHATLDSLASEGLVVAASRYGEAIPNAVNTVENFEAVMTVVTQCEEMLYDLFAERMADFEAENAMRCHQQETSASRFAERRTSELQERLARFRAQGNLRPIPMTEGLVKREEAQLRAKLALISRRRVTDPSLIRLAIGVIQVD